MIVSSVIGLMVDLISGLIVGCSHDLVEAVIF